MSKYGNCRYDITLQPVSGKAIPVYKGEVLRIIQVGGEQCVDFNCFNLHDYKERMSVGHMRVQGFRVKEGHIAVSAPPRYRPMLAILHMAETCISDLLGARCDATAGEREYGLVPRTNCQDTFGEAIREYGLTPDDVHDSFNMWMHTVWKDSFFPVRNIGPKGDYVDLLALMDVLAVPITCGSGDIGQISNFGFKPIQVQVFEASDHSTRCHATLSRQMHRIQEPADARRFSRQGNPQGAQAKPRARLPTAISRLPHRGEGDRSGPYKGRTQDH